MLAHHTTIEEADEERMSADGPQQTEEEGRPIKKPVLRLQSFRPVLDYWQIAFKLLELTICILCTSLVVDPLKMANIGSKYIHHISLIFATYIGYIVIITILLLGRLFQDKLPYKTSAIFSLVGCGLFLTTGCVILSEREHLSRNHFFHPNMYMYNMIVTSGIFAIINAIIFILDAIFVIRYQNDL